MLLEEDLKKEGVLLTATHNQCSQALTHASFFAKLKSDFDNGKFSWVGDFRDFALGYLTFASTLLARAPGDYARPVGAVVIGETSTGKTELANSLMRLFPNDHVICVTSLSAKSLIYRCIQDPYCLNGKVVFVEELSGLRNEDLQYLLRILVTRGEARHMTIISGKPVEIYVRGYISLQTTGLPSDRLRDDTMNRLVTIKSDSSPHMTIKVIDEIKRRYSEDIENNCCDGNELTWYHDFFKQLTPYNVHVPFAAELPLSGTEPESRRMAKIAMDLLCTITLLNQDERICVDEKSLVIAEMVDFELLRQIMRSSFEDRQLQLSDREMIILDSIKRLQNPDRFSYEDLLILQPGKNSGIDGGYSLTSIKYAINGLEAKNKLLKLGRLNRKQFFSLL